MARPVLNRRFLKVTQVQVQCLLSSLENDIYTRFRLMFPRPGGYLASCQMTADGEIIHQRKTTMDPPAYQALAHYNFFSLFS